MTERPILFSGPMVRALLDGSKTQTRRVVKLPHNNPLGKWEPTTFGGPDGGRTRNGETVPLHTAIWHTRTGDSIGAQWVVGDRLWVREAWKAHTTFDHLPPREIPESHIWYMADDGYKAESRYRQGMFMPRWACRITLEVTAVRVERLQDISAADARAEGVAQLPNQAAEPGAWWTADVAAGHRLHGSRPETAYRLLWESINGPSSWDANPWVWVIEFKRVAK